MSQYLKENLLPGETLICKGHYHWAKFFRWSSMITFGVKPLIEQWTDEILLTNKRVIVKTGLISTDVMELHIKKIESINFSQSIKGRIFGYGTIEIRGTGGSVKILKLIGNPSSFKQAFLKLA